MDYKLPQGKQIPGPHGSTPPGCSGHHPTPSPISTNRTSSTLLPVNCGPNPTLSRTLSHIMRTEGLSGLYRPILPTLAMAVPANVLYFVTYETVRDWLSAPLTSGEDKTFIKDGSSVGKMKNENNSASYWYAAPISGVFARFIAVIASAPFETLRTQLGARTDGGLFSLLKEQLSLDKNNFSYRKFFLDLFRGVQPTMFRDVPFSSVYWLSYEQLKNITKPYFITENQNSKSSSKASSSNEVSSNEPSSGEVLTHSFICGAVSGSLASIISHPFDVVKTRWQTDPPYSEQNFIQKQNGNKPKTLFTSLQNVFREKKAFAGLTPRLLRVAPACAIMISSYEVCKSF